MWVALFILSLALQQGIGEDERAEPGNKGNLTVNSRAGVQPKVKQRAYVGNRNAKTNDADTDGEKTTDNFSPTERLPIAENNSRPEVQGRNLGVSPVGAVGIRATGYGNTYGTAYSGHNYGSNFATSHFVPVNTYGTLYGSGNHGHNMGVGYAGSTNNYGTVYGAHHSVSGPRPVVYSAARPHTQPVVPIRIPYVDKNGCRFVGDVVCNPELDPIGFHSCVLSTESKNLWTKQSLTVDPRYCWDNNDEPTRVLSTFCNNNDRLTQAVGVTKSLDEPFLYNAVKRDYFFFLEPCLVVYHEVTTTTESTTTEPNATTDDTPEPNPTTDDTSEPNTTTDDTTEPTPP